MSVFRNYNIFVFGNSIVFGYGQPDNLTIASYVQYYLRQDVGTENIAVYNFGRAVYFSDLERRLFESLISDGYVPDAALFIDGLTEFTLWHGRTDQFRCRQEPSFTKRLGDTLRCKANEICLPAQEVAEDWAGFLDSDERAESSIAPLPDTPPLDDETTNRAVTDRWLANKTAIESVADSHDVATVFVIQPVPVYKYDLQYHLFGNTLEDFNDVVRVHYGYTLWEDLFDDPDADWTGNVVNLMAAGEDNPGPIFVDETHYSFGFSDEVGRAIADAFIEWEIIPDTEGN